MFVNAFRFPSGEIQDSRDQRKEDGVNKPDAPEETWQFPHGTTLRWIDISKSPHAILFSHFRQKRNLKLSLSYAFSE